jgi:hypothetical protein
MDHNIHQIKYKTHEQYSLQVTNPSNGMKHDILRVLPKNARQMLRVLLAPDGNAFEQLHTIMQKINTSLEKTQNCRWSHKTRWKALNSVLEPGILYPLMATLYTIDDIKQLERKIAKIHCQALGLNMHFPRAVLYRPCELGGMEIDTLQTLLTTICINYFLYCTRQHTSVGEKIEISLAHMQLEVGLCQQVFLTSYQQYHYLATRSLIKCLWGETEPFGLYIKGGNTTVWTPTLQGPTDIPITEFAVTHFPSSYVCRINRCQLYLQVFTLYDLFNYDGSNIHPEIGMGERIQSRKTLLKGLLTNILRVHIGRYGTDFY